MSDIYGWVTDHYKNSMSLNSNDLLFLTILKTFLGSSKQLFCSKWCLRLAPSLTCLMSSLIWLRSWGLTEYLIPLPHIFFSSVARPFCMVTQGPKKASSKKTSPKFLLSYCLWMFYHGRSHSQCVRWIHEDMNTGRCSSLGVINVTVYHTNVTMLAVVDSLTLCLLFFY